MPEMRRRRLGGAFSEGESLLGADSSDSLSVSGGAALAPPSAPLREEESGVRRRRSTARLLGGAVSLLSR
jgi:hypothetical protein